MRKPRQPRQPRQPMGGNVPSILYRVASVAPTGDPRCPAMVSVEVGVVVFHGCCLEDEMESGRLTLGTLKRWIERPGGGLQEVPMVDFGCQRIKRQLEREALAALAALIGSAYHPRTYSPADGELTSHPSVTATSRLGQPRGPEAR